MAYTKASMKATNKWMKNNYDRISLTVQRGIKDIWKSVAEENDLSLNEFIRLCVDEKIDSLNKQST